MPKKVATVASIYCIECGFDNEEHRAACLMCYAFLRDTGTGRSCSACGGDNPPHASFCRQCGAQLDLTAAPPVRRAELIQAVLEGIGGGLVGGAEEEELAGLPGESSEFDLVGPIGPVEAAPEAPAPSGPPVEAAPPAAPPPPPPPTSAGLVEEEEELAPPPPLPGDFELELPTAPPPPEPQAPVGAEEEAGPRVSSEEFELDFAAPPPPPPGIEDLAPPPPPAPAEPTAPAPPSEEPSEPAQAPPPPPGTIEILEDEDEFRGWELDFGDAGGEQKD